ncbi:MAG: helicase associated domain-containing protein [Candidatus Brocadiaceae bacterium]|uniref:helicase associated domain-containing protein n=1 Tax=Candidatus Wunengus sp. YC61 TaxID=3367698 RepID=UPI0027272D98|nr:helicase associated domain-containing protein [Candidatus Brocadiaceae bacterium]
MGFKWNLTDDTFGKGFQETVKYKEQFGNPNAPVSYKTHEGYSLGSWQVTQRQFYKNGKLPSDRIQKLEEIKFTWDRLDEMFEKGFQNTAKYKEQYGNANLLPEHRTSSFYKELYTWQRNKIRSYKKGKLSGEKTKRLEEIGFRFDLPTQHEESFEKGFHLTVKYKKENGIANVARDCVFRGFKLGRWQHNMRTRKYVLSESEIRRLEEIGFSFDLKRSHSESFEKGFQETVKYKEQYGNPNARWGYKTTDNFDLYQWQSQQRRIKNKLSTEEVKRLEEIGLRLDDIKTKLPPDESFEKGFTETIKYKEQHGDANVPHGYKTLQGYKLRRWQECQRSSYKKGKLDREKIRRLEDVGFVWSLRKDAFKVGLQETIKYKERFGYPNAPQNYVTAEGFNLGSWQNTKRQSYKMGKLSDERIRKLEEVGFKWNFNIEDESFEKGFNETLKYKEQFGNANAPPAYKTSDGYPLGRWQSKRRQAYKGGRLSPEKIKRFEEIGFVFKPYDASFEKGLMETLKYKEQFGDPNAPDSCKLGKWQGKKRQAYKKGKLSPERIKRLEDIGFKWQLDNKRK